MNIVIRKRITKVLFLILLVFAVGTSGFYYLLDGLTFIDALYFTIVTLATVGYGDFTPHTNMPPGGNPYLIKFFAIFIILFGMSTLLYGIGVMTEYIVSGEMLGERRRKRMQKLISSLRNHYIICGAGETSAYMMQELKKTKRPFVVIDKSEERIQQILNQFDELLYIQGDATHDEILEQAGLEHAVGVITSLPDEKDNLFVAMSLSQKKKERGFAFRIAAKVTNFEKMASKIKSAGADCVISPEYISGRRMISEMFRPSVTTFLDRMLKDDRAVMRVEEVTVSSDSSLVGKNLKETRISNKIGLLIAAVQKGGKGEFIHNPNAEQVIDEGDVLITMGDMDKIAALRKLAQGK
ncbi:MAG: potassium channel protein [Deltaproteobacteria bacterium]|nr:potassium channel protein [Deltaproteobacteria bacterium]